MGVFEDGFFYSEVEVEFEGFLSDFIGLEPELTDSFIFNYDKNTFGD